MSTDSPSHPHSIKGGNLYRGGLEQCISPFSRQAQTEVEVLQSKPADASIFRYALHAQMERNLESILN